MKKDYLPVSAETGDLDEAGFVEQYWTSQWKDRTAPPVSTGVEHSEEYRIIRPYLSRLPAGSRVLDGGCGMGQWTLFLAGLGFNTVGADISEATIKRLAQWFPEQNFVHADLRATDFAGESFDAYLSWGTFEHFEIGLGACLREAHRLLKPGGLLCISVPFHSGRLMRRERRPLEGWDEHYDTQRGYAQPQRFYQWRFTEPELRRELEIHGFNVETISHLAKDTGAGRFLDWDCPSFTKIFPKGSLPYRAARRAVSKLPASFISHMILGVSVRR